MHRENYVVKALSNRYSRPVSIITLRSAGASVAANPAGNAAHPNQTAIGPKPGEIP